MTVDELLGWAGAEPSGSPSDFSSASTRTYWRCARTAYRRIRSSRDREALAQSVFRLYAVLQSRYFSRREGPMAPYSLWIGGVDCGLSA
jgi:hypothetical protein